MVELITREYLHRGSVRMIRARHKFRINLSLLKYLVYMPVY